jgi:hypothetical protein
LFFLNYIVFIYLLFDNSTFSTIIIFLSSALLVLSAILIFLLSNNKIKKNLNELLPTFPHFYYNKITIDAVDIKIKLINRKYVRGMIVARLIKDYIRLLNNFQPTSL